MLRHLILLIVFGAGLNLNAQQSLYYELKLTQVYSNYPLNGDRYRGPDISYQINARLVGLNNVQTTGSAFHYESQLDRTGWIDIPDQTIVSGIYTAGNNDPPIDLCNPGIFVAFDQIRAWEKDDNNEMVYNPSVDDDLLSGSIPRFAFPELASSSGQARVEQQIFTQQVNGYYGFEFSLRYLLIGGISEVVLTGDTEGGPVADACDGGQVYIHPRTGPGFTGGKFQYWQSSDSGNSWSPLGPPSSNDYKSVQVTGDPTQQFAVSLAGGAFGCLGSLQRVEAVNLSDLDIFSSIKPEEIALSTTPSCPNANSGSVTMDYSGTLSANTSVRLQLQRLGNDGIVVDNPSATVTSFPYTFDNVPPGAYRINATVISNQNLSDDILANCTTRSVNFTIGSVAPPGLVAVTPFNPGCGETTGSVRVYSQPISQTYQLLDEQGAVMQTSPLTTATTYDFNNLAPGNYQVRAQQLSCETGVLAFTIDAPPAAANGTVEVVEQAPPFDIACEFTNTTVNFRPTPGTGAYDILIYTRNLGVTGDYPIRVGEVSEGGTFSEALFAYDFTAEFRRKDNGCSFFVDFTVDEDPNQLWLPDCNFGPCPVTVAPTVCMPNSGQATFPITGGIPPYSIVINGNPAPPTSTTDLSNGTEFFYDNLPGGEELLVNVSDSRGCLRQFGLTIPAATQFSTVLLGARLNLNCNGDTDGRVEIRVNPSNPGTPPYTYKVREINDVFGSNPIFENIPPGNYTAVARDASGCETENAFTITEPDPLVLEDVYVIPPGCAGDEHQVYLSVSGPALCDDYAPNEPDPPPFNLIRNFYEYSTDGGNTWIRPGFQSTLALSWDNCSFQQRIDFPLPPGNYTFQLRRRDEPSCLSNAISLTAAEFNSPPPLSLGLNATQNPACAGDENGTITLDYGGGSGGYELELVRFSGTNPPTGPTVVETVDFVAAAGSYTFGGLAGDNAGYAIRLRNKLADGTILDENCVAYFPGNYAAGENFTPIQLTTPADLQGGNIVTAQPLDCTGTGATITVSGVSGGTPPYMYSNNGAAFTTATTLEAAAENTVTVRDAAGCTSTLQHTVTEQSDPPQQMTFDLLPPLGCDPSIRGTLSVTLGDGPYTYAYAQTADGNGEPQDPVIANTAVSSLELDELQPGNLFVRLTTGDGCSKLFNFSIGDPGYQPLTADILTNPASCNDATGSFIVTVQGGVAPYEIAFNGTIMQGATLEVPNQNAGTYLVGIRDAAGCRIIEQVEVTSSTEGFPITIGGAPATPCADNANGSITITPTGGTPPFTLVWEDGAPGGTITNIGQTYTRSGLARMEYDLAITDGNGCMVIRTVMPGGRDPLTAQIIDVVQPICGGAATGGFTVNIVRNSFPESSNFTVSLNGGAPQNQLVFNDLAAGDYTVEVFDDTGCGATETLMITLEAAGQITANSSVTNVDCSGAATGSVTLTASGTGAPFQYALEGGLFQDSPVFPDLLAGTYTFTVRGTDGCTITLPGVIVADGPTVDGQFTLTNPTCAGEATGSIEVVASGGMAPYTYILNGGPPQTNPTFSGLNDGTYEVIIIDANGCSFTSGEQVLQAPAAVTATPTATPVSCFGNSDGSISILGGGGNGTYEYSVDGGAYAGAMNVVGLSAGDYTVRVRDGNGCESDPVIVNVGSPDEINITVTNITPENCGQADGTATATAFGGTGDLTFNWPGNLGGPAATNLVAGDYEVTVTDANNCVQTQAFTIGSTGGPTLSLQNSSPTRCDANTGSLTVSPDDGVAPLTYVWSHDANLNAPQADNLAAGDYTVTITDFNGCAFELTATVATSPEPTLSLGSVTDSQCTDDNGTATVIPGGGMAPYNYTWSHATGLNTPTLNDLASGNYTVTVIDANGCTDAVSFTIGFVSGPSGITATTLTATTCGLDNGSIALQTQGGTAPYAYTWADFPTESTGNLTGLAAGDYAVTATDANGCTSSATFTVGGSLIPSVSVASQTEATCGESNATVTLTTENFAAPLTFAWSHDVSLNADQATNLAAGDYTVVVTDANNCQAEVSFTIIAVGGPALTLSDRTPTRCDADTGSLSVTPNGGVAPFTYVWSHDASLNAPQANNLAAGDYTVTITDANGCSNELTATVDPSPEPTLSLGNITDSECTDGNGTATVIPGGGVVPYTYAWSHAGGLNTPSLDNLLIGDYTVSLTDGNGCSAEVSFTIGFVAGPIGLLASANTGTTCGLDNGSLVLQTEGGTPPFTYAWSDSPTASGSTRTDLAAGNYVVTTTDANGCSLEATFNIAGSLSPTLTITEQSQATCGEANGTLTIATENLTAPLDYDWSNDPTLEQPQATGIAPGIYSVVVTDVNNCQVFTEFTIVAIDEPALTTIQVQATACDRNTGVIEVSPVAGVAPFSYSWSHRSTLNAPIAEGLASGNYTVTVTDSNGCESTLTETVPNSPLPTLAVEAINASTCGNSNGSATLMASGGTPPFTYEWSHTGELDSNTANDLPAGNYTATVTDSNGCSAAVSLNIGSIPGATGISVVSLTGTTCGLDNGSLAVQPQGGTAPYNYTWADAPTETGGSRVDLAAGDYPVTVTDANGCTVSSTFIIPDSPAPTVTIVEQTEATCGVANAIVTIATENFTPPLDYDWSNDPDLEGPQSTNIAAGVYSIVVTDAIGCRAFAEFAITSAEGPSLTTVRVQPDACDGNTGEIEVSPLGGQAPLTYTWSHDNNLNAPLATGLSGGNYTVTITDVNGCSFTLTENVSNTPLPQLTIVETMNTMCGDGNGSATVEATTGTPPYTYSWSHDPEASGPSQFDLMAGEYSVVVTDVNGCTAEVSFSIDLTPEVTGITLLEQINTSCGAANGSLSLAGEGGTPPYTFTWEDFPDNTTGLVENISDGTYPVTVIDANNCTFTTTFTVAPSLTPEVILVSQTDASCGLALGRIEVEARDFTGLIVYEWSHDANLNEPVAEDLLGGEYTVLVRDEQDCQATLVVTVDDAPGPSLELVAINNTLCEEGNGSIEVAYTSGGQAPLTYSWSHAPTLNSSTAVNLSAGDYTVTIRDANGCTTSITASVVLEAPPAITGLSLAPATCAQINGQASFTINGGSPPLLYSWSHDPELNAPSADNLPPGETTFTVTDANGCFATQQFTIDDLPGTTGIALLDLVATTCGQENGSISVSPIGGQEPLTYTWSHDGNLNGPLAENLAAGTYDLTITDANECSVSASYSIAPSIPLSIGVDSLSQTNCNEADGYIAVLVSGNTGSLTYQWSHDPNLNAPIASDLPAATYTLMVSDGLGCTDEQTFVIENLNNPAQVSISATPTVCTNDNGSVAVMVTNGQAPIEYEWAHDPDLSGPLAADLPAGNYTVTVTDASGCTTMISAAVEFLSPPTVMFEVTPLSCDDNTLGSLSVSLEGGTAPFTYLWSTNAVTDSIGGLAAGNYQVTVTDANNCETIATGTIEPITLPTLTVARTTAENCLPAGGSATLVTDLPFDEVVVNWPGPSGNVTLTSQPDGGTEIVLFPLNAGTYPVAVSGANGCTTEIDVVITSAIDWTASVSEINPPTCFDTTDGSISVNIAGAGFFDYQWDAAAAGQTAPIATNLGPGGYSVLITDTDGCERTLSAEIVAPDTLRLSLVEQTELVCPTDSTASLAVMGSGGSGALSYRWNLDGLPNAPMLNNLPAGDYRLTMTDENGCTATLATTISAPAEGALSLPADTTICQDNFYVLDLSDFVGPMITGPNGFTSTSPVSLLEAAGSYQVTVEDTLGCTLEADFQVNVTDAAFVAGMVVPSDVVIGDSVVILETSWPAPESVEWFFDRPGAQQVRQVENQYWFLFDEVGVYQLNLIAGFGGCKDLTTKQITVHADSTTIPNTVLGRPIIEEIIVSPNPNTGQFEAAITLSNPAALVVNLYDNNGARLERRQGDGASAYNFTYDLTNPQAGAYHLLVQTAFGRRSTVIIVE